MIHSIGQSGYTVLPQARPFLTSAHCYSSPLDTSETHSVHFQGREKTRPAVVGILDAEGPLSVSTALYRKEGTLNSLNPKDRRGWIRHGSLVSGFARAMGQNVRITPFYMSSVAKRDEKTDSLRETIDDRELLRGLRRVKRHIDSGHPLDALSVSLGPGLDIEELKSELAIPEIKADNVLRYRKAILEYLRQDDPNTYEALRLMEEIAGKTNVVVTNTNEKGYINAFGLLKGVEVVGESYHGYKRNENGTVSQWADVNRVTVPVYDRMGRLVGFDLTPELQEPGELYACHPNEPNCPAQSDAYRRTSRKNPKRRVHISARHVDGVKGYRRGMLEHSPFIPSELRGASLSGPQIAVAIAAH